jgi:hypothetical protein
MNKLTKNGIAKKLIANKHDFINFIYWRHFTFSDILGYCGAYFIPGNKYEIDRVFITGEFRKLDNTKYTATFALNIEEIIIITQETANIRWKHIS